MDIVRVDVDRTAIELCGLAYIAELLIDYAVLIARLAVSRRDLQSIAKFNARLFKVTGR